MKIIPCLLLAALVAIGGREAAAQTTATTTPVGFLNVQGVLHENGQPVNGFWYFCFDVFAAPTGGTSLAHDTNMNYVAVSNGVANVTYRIGDLAALSLSPTQDLYLQMDVSRTGEPGSFTVLSPRQRIVPAMFATSAVRAEEARRLIEPLSANLMPTTVSNLTFTGKPVFGATSGPPFAVTSKTTVANLMAECADYALNAYTLGGLYPNDFWQLLGNAGTVAGLNFLGTTDNQPLELKVYNQRALRLEPNPIAPNIIAGSAANAVTGTEGASILGGHLNTINANALFSVIGGGAENLIDVNAENSTISGGRRNTIQADAERSTIGGGATNVIQAYTDFATIGGGVNNNIQSGGTWSTIGGGRTNVILSPESTIGGGGYHYIGNGAESATISGGYHNYIDTLADYSTIGGGNFNYSSSYKATIGGGVSNRVHQGAVHGTVAGGYSNIVERTSAAIGGGERNGVLAVGGTIAGGLANQIQYEAKGSVIGGGAGQVVEQHVTNGVIAGGLGNVIHSNANFSAIGGGRENHIGSSAPFATIPGGREAKAFNYGQVAYAGGGFGGQEGTAQGSFYVLRGATTDNMLTEIFLDGAGERIHVPAASTWAYDVLVTARDSAAISAGFQIRGMMGYNAAGALVALGVPIITQLSGAPAITAQVLPDNVNKALTVKVTWGLANPQTARWVATVRTAEVVFPAN